ncbi:putative replication protein A [Methylocella tundrae]|nr:putative replication protein A [Methylocella tundrae]
MQRIKMATAAIPNEGRLGDLRALINADAAELSARLRAQQMRDFPPAAQKTIRRFSPSEAAKLIGIHEGYLRQLVAEGKGPPPQSNNRRTYSVEDIEALRIDLDRSGKGTRRYVPHRKGDEALQIISVMNFKGGSGKTTTAAHLAQFLALRGYRALAIDLDPQASLSTLFGHQPELDVGDDETLYGAIRYDEDRREMAEIVRSTYIPNLHLVPGQLELMEFEHETPKVLMERRGQDSLFFSRIGEALGQVSHAYDVVVIDCPPQLGFLTLSALCAATAVLITVHPQMLDVMSMSQFLNMTGGLLDVVADAGGATQYDWMRYLVTRYEPSDGPQTTMVGLMRSIFGSRVLTHPMLKSTAIADAGLTKQTLYEVERQQFTRGTYDRAIEALDLVNGEVEGLVRQVWRRP